MAHIETALTLRNLLARNEAMQPSQVAKSGYQALVASMYHADNSQAALPNYRAFMHELLAQWNAVIQVVDVEFCDDDPTPMDANGAPSSKLMIAEVERTNVLRVFRSGGDHVVLDVPAVEWKGRTETYNSIFRAVHDFLGHCATGASFGWKGETQAYYSHAMTFSDEARCALFCETVAQQCVYAVTGDYAEQKIAYFPKTLHFPPLA